MPGTATTELDRLLDELEDSTPISGTRALTDTWALLAHVPQDDPLYPRVEALMTVVDALIRVEDVTL